MTALGDAVSQLAADDTALGQEVAQVITILQGLPAQIASDVQAALASAGVDDAAQTAALAAIDASVKQTSADLVAAIASVTPATSAPAPAEPAPTDVTPVDANAGETPPPPPT